MKKLLTPACLYVATIVAIVSFITASTVFGQERKTANVNSSTTTSTDFTVDDLLDLVNINVADLSDDGRWLAAATGSLRDRIGIDNRRFGDPTYVAPSVVDVWIIDTETAKAQRLFPTKRQVRGVKWSPDASRLALFVLNGDMFEPMIWERASGKLTAVKPPGSMIAAENAELQWSADSSQLIFALHNAEWKKKAAERFDYETRGPVVVHSSKEHFHQNRTDPAKQCDTGRLVVHEGAGSSVLCDNSAQHDLVAGFHALIGQYRQCRMVQRQGKTRGDTGLVAARTDQSGFGTGAQCEAKTIQ